MTEPTEQPKAGLMWLCRGCSDGLVAKGAEGSGFCRECFHHREVDKAAAELRDGIDGGIATWQDLKDSVKAAPAPLSGTSTRAHAQQGQE